MPLAKESEITVSSDRYSIRMSKVGHDRPLPLEAEPFLLVKARQRARSDVRKALAQDVAITHVNLVMGKDGRTRRVIEKVRADGRVERLDGPE